MFAGVDVQLGGLQLDHTADEVCSLGCTADWAGLSGPKAVAFCAFRMFRVPHVNHNHLLFFLTQGFRQTP